MTHPTKLIDAHHHCWIPEQYNPDLGYGWLRDIGAMKPFGDPSTIQRDYVLKEFRAEFGQHMLGSVHVQCDGGMRDPVGETAWLQKCADDADFPLAIISFLDLSKPDAATQLEQHQHYNRFRGVRQILSYLPARPDISFAAHDLLSDTVFRQNFALLANNDCLFEAQLYPEQAPAFAKFLAQQPQTQIIIDHALSPYDCQAGGIEQWREAVKILAEYPDMAIKISGFGMFDPQWSAASVQPMVMHILEEFGANRVLFGSNFPVEKLVSHYDYCVAKIAETLPKDPDIIHAVFTENAQRLYSLDI